MKTSAFPEADVLAGYELIGIVQGETNVQASVATVSGFVSQYAEVFVGRGAEFYGFSSVAIGAASSAQGSTSSMAIGAEGLVVGFLPLSIGSPTYVMGDYAVAVGKYNFVAGSPTNVTVLGASNECSSSANYGTAIGTQSLIGSPSQVAIGHAIQSSEAENSVLIGSVFTTVAPDVSVGIGYHLGSYGPYCVAIGTNSKAIYRGVTVGFYSGFHSVPYEAAGESSIAIGTHNYVPVGPAIAIGYDCLSVYKGVALGTSLVDDETVAIGYNNNGEGTRAVAIGSVSGATGNSVVLGNRSNTDQNYSMVLGSQISDPAIGGTFVNAGVPTSSALRPVVFHQKLIGSTISPKEATAAWGNGSYTATVTWDTTGVIGNDLTLNVADNISDESFATSIDGDTFSILLATDDPSTNTLANIAGLFPTGGFSFSYTDGFDTSVVTFTGTQSFTGGADGSPTIVLTADGSGPSINNLPAIYTNSLATITGSVVGVTPNLFESAGDTASFTLAPVIVVKGEALHRFIGTPTFTMTSNTDGASDWGAPVLTTAEDATLLEITVTNTDADVNWMAHLTFEASQNDIS